MKKNLLHLMLVLVILSMSLSLAPAAANLPDQPGQQPLRTHTSDELQTSDQRYLAIQPDPTLTEHAIAASLDRQGPGASDYI